MNQPIVPGRIPLDQRAAIMEQVLRDLAFRGYRIEVVDGDRAIVSMGEPVNHLLHVVLMVFTCGLWFPIWILIMCFGGIKRRRIHVDEYGNLVGL